MKIPPVRAEFFHTDRRTDGQTDEGLNGWTDGEK